jgi:hypothetical protein
MRLNDRELARVFDGAAPWEHAWWRGGLGMSSGARARAVEAQAHAPPGAAAAAGGQEEEEAGAAVVVEGAQLPPAGEEEEGERLVG